MQKLTYELFVTLKALEKKPHKSIKSLADIIKNDVVITLKEVAGLVKLSIENRWINKANNGLLTLTKTGVIAIESQVYEPNLNLTVPTTPAKNGLNKHKEKDVTMKIDLIKSIEQLRSKLEAKPPKKIEQFEDKVELIDAISELPGIDQPLVILLKEIKSDLQKLQLAAEEAEGILIQ